MAVSDHWSRVVKMRGTVVAVDPAKNIIDVRCGDGGVRRLMVWEVPNGFTWPIDGEDWSVYEQNGSWYLGDRANSIGDAIPIHRLAPGDQRLGGKRTVARHIQIESDDEAILDFYDRLSATDRKRSRLVNAGGYTYLQSANDAYDQILNTGLRYDHTSGHILMEKGGTTDTFAKTVTSGETLMQVRDVGEKNQIRAGREVSWFEFVELGIGNGPLGLWHLGAPTIGAGEFDFLSLTNKGGLVSLGVGINGEAGTAAVFHGSTSEALYINAEPNLALHYGSWGCWFRTAKRGVAQTLLCRYRGGAGNYGFHLGIQDTNQVYAAMSTNGSADFAPRSGVDVADDRWHHAVATFDGTYGRVYVDGKFNAIATASPEGPLYVPGTVPFNIGALGADATTAALNPFYGSIDEAFITTEVLTAEEIHLLYCARIPHTFPTTPTRASVNVRKAKRGARLLVTDFPVAPKHLYNFSSTYDNEGSGPATPLSGVAGWAPGRNGKQAHAVSFNGSTNVLTRNATDLPYGSNPRSAGCWFKCHVGIQHAGSYGLICLSGVDTRLLYIGNGAYQIGLYDSVTALTGGPGLVDGFWHHAVGVSNSAADDGLRHKVYLDGKLVASSTAAVAATAAPTGLLIGRTNIATEYFPGIIDSVFICDYALTPEEIHAIYNASGVIDSDSNLQPPSPKNPGDHIHAIEQNSLLVTFDTLDGGDHVEVRVAG